MPPEQWVYAYREEGIYLYVCLGPRRDLVMALSRHGMETSKINMSQLGRMGPMEGSHSCVIP